MTGKLKHLACCAGMANCLNNSYITRDVIGDYVFFAIATDKKDKEGNPIGLVLQNCLCCGKKVYPDVIKEAIK